MTAPGVTPMTASVGALYALGLKPKAIAARLRIGQTSVKSRLTALMIHWSAPSWASAARLEWIATTGEEWPE